MKLPATFCIAALGLGLAAPACVEAQKAPAGIIGEKGVAPESTAGKTSTQTKRIVLPAARTGTVTPAAQATLRSGVAPNALSAIGNRSDNQNDKGPPNEPSNENMGRLAGEAGWAGQVDEKLPHKEPKGPDKMPVGISKVGWAGKSEDKPLPKEPEPKDPKGPDKLGNVALKAGTTEAAATRASPHAVQQATQVRSVDAARQVANDAKLQGQP